MPHSSATKTSWSSASERAARPAAARPSGPLVELHDLSLRFISFQDKQYSLKRAVLDLLLRRETPPDASFGALRGVTLRIEPGERVGIVGSNGAGKSSLLRVLARIYPPTSGTMTVRGR